VLFALGNFICAQSHLADKGRKAVAVKLPASPAKALSVGVGD